MAKNSVSEWSTVSSGNGDIAGLTLGLDMPPSYVNNAMQEMMAQIKQWKDGYTDPETGLSMYQSLTVKNIDVKGEFQLNGSTGTFGQVMVSQGASASPIWGSGFPVGGIILWSGSTGTIPSGWRLCDGGGGTPDLRNRFVVGAGSTYAVNATGGSANSDLQQHSHSATSSVTDPGHNHEMIGAGFPDTFNKSPHVPSRVKSGPFVSSDWSAKTGISVSTSISKTGSGNGTNANLPPYYALCYIMKL